MRPLLESIAVVIAMEMPWVVVVAAKAMAAVNEPRVVAPVMAIPMAIGIGMAILLVPIWKQTMVDMRIVQLWCHSALNATDFIFHIHLLDIAHL